jgi:hypothetical protein
MALARAHGYVTLHAAASPMHADLHYGVVVEALRPLVLAVDAGARTSLVEGLPDLGRLFDGLHLSAPAPLGDMECRCGRPGGADRILDVGAGAAPWSLAIARRNPRCRVTALDLGAVLAVTRRAVATAGQADRFDYISGDVFDGNEAPSTERLLVDLRVHFVKANGRPSPKSSS